MSQNVPMQNSINRDVIERTMDDTSKQYCFPLGLDFQAIRNRESVKVDLLSEIG